MADNTDTGSSTNAIQSPMPRSIRNIVTGFTRPTSTTVMPTKEFDYFKNILTL